MLFESSMQNNWGYVAVSNPEICFRFRNLHLSKHLCPHTHLYHFDARGGRVALSETQHWCTVTSERLLSNELELAFHTVYFTGSPGIYKSSLKLWEGWNMPVVKGLISILFLCIICYSPYFRQFMVVLFLNYFLELLNWHLHSTALSLGRW